MPLPCSFEKSHTGHKCISAFNSDTTFGKVCRGLEQFCGLAEILDDEIAYLGAVVKYMAFGLMALASASCLDLSPQDQLSGDDLWGKPGDYESFANIF